jgi:hypothetical protein
MGGGAGKPAKQDATSGREADPGMQTGVTEEKLDVPDYTDILQESTDEVVSPGEGGGCTMGRLEIHYIVCIP